MELGKGEITWKLLQY